MSRRGTYPVRIPHFAAGIRAQGVRSAGRRPWWERRWTASLEAMHLGTRLGRGKSYAVSGQVTELRIEGPYVEAKVVGSRDEPYLARLEFTAAEGAARERIERGLRGQPMLLARLLTGDLPTEVEALFREAGLSLFPDARPATGPDGRRRYDVTTTCSCPDYANPCKHLAAVLCLLGEEIARCPATLLALRGVDVDAMLGGDPGGGGAEGGADRRPAGAAAGADAVAGAAAGLRLDQVAPTSILTRLGPIPFWRGAERCAERLARIYARVSPVAVEAAKGPVDLRPEGERVVVRGGAMQLKERALSPSS